MSKMRNMQIVQYFLTPADGISHEVAESIIYAATKEHLSDPILVVSPATRHSRQRDGKRRICFPILLSKFVEAKKIGITSIIRICNGIASTVALSRKY